MSRIIIGANSAVIRGRLESVLANDRRMELIGSYSVERALAQVETLQPDILLLYSGSPVDESLSTMLESTGAPAGVIIVLLTDDPEMFLRSEAIRGGFRGILAPAATPDEILAAIDAAVAGLVVIQPGALESVFPAREDRSDLVSSYHILTPREIEVLRMVADGLGNKEIAEKLGISDHTVKFHLSSLFAKLGASNRAEAVSLGIRMGLLMV